MVGFHLQFLAGRFHASPWDRSVNETEVEWPPAPWRMLAALTQAWRGANEPDPPLFVTLLDALAEPPSYLLPPTTPSHLPAGLTHSEEDSSDRDDDVLLDRYVALQSIPTSEAFVLWPRVILSDEEIGLLRFLSSRIKFLGQPASWCKIEIITSSQLGTGELQKKYTHHSFVDLASRVVGNGPTVLRRAVSAGERGSSLLSALDETMQKRRRPRPKAVIEVEYRFPPRYGLRAPEPQHEPDIPLMPERRERFILTAPTDALRPSIILTLDVAEAFRNATMKQYSARNQICATGMISGKDHDGSPAQHHGHAYYLPRDLDNDGIIDHIDVYFPKGSTHEEHRAIMAVQKLYRESFGLERDQSLTINYLSQVEISPGRVWKSATPCVLDRFPKRNSDDPKSQVIKMLERHGLASHLENVFIDPRGGRVQHNHGGTTPFKAFHTQRVGKPQVPSVNVTLRFTQDVILPMSFGRLAHFGLGQFVVIEDSLPSSSATSLLGERTS